MAKKTSGNSGKLRVETQKWFAKVEAAFVLEEHHRRLLLGACQAWDLAQEARKILSKQGLTYQDRFGAPRLRPENNICRDQMIIFIRTLRELGLDVTPPNENRLPQNWGRNHKKGK